MSRIGSAGTALACLLLAGCGGEAPQGDEASMAVEPGAAMDTTPAGTPAPPSPEVVNDALDGQITAELAEWRVELSRDTVPAGEVTFHAMNTGTMQHSLEVEGQGTERKTGPIAPGETATLAVSLQPGTYQVYCPVEAQGVVHAQRGMRTELIVVPDNPTLMRPPGS